MKKLLGSTLALALLFPAAANAELLKNLQLSGELDVDGVSANNMTDINTKTYDNIGTVQDRLMLHADWDVLDDVHGRVSIDKNDRTWGTGSQNLGSGAGGVQSVLTIDEANVKIKQLFGALDTTIGRQYYGEKGDMVIYFGPKDDLYGLPITSLDAVKFDWAGDKVNATVLASKLTGGKLGAADTGNVSLYGIDVHFKPSDMASGSVYVYDRYTVNSGTSTPAVGVLPDDILYVAGVRAKIEMGGAWLKAEFDKDFGQNRPVTATGGLSNNANYTGWAGKLDIGAKQDINGVGAVTGWGTAGVGSGGTSAQTFTSIAGDYRPGDIFGRFFVPNGGGVTQGAPTTTANVGTNNLGGMVIVGIGAKITPASLSKLTAGVSVYNYRYQNVLSAQGVMNAQGFHSVDNGNKLLGNEYDLDLNWQHSENVSVGAGVGTFQPGNFVRADAAGFGYSPATLAYADLKLKFGGSSN
jgi:hypothetical protein